VITPIEVVLDPGVPHGALTPAVNAATLRLAHELLDQPDVFVVAIGTRPPYVDSSGRYRRTVVIERADFGAEVSNNLFTSSAPKCCGGPFPARRTGLCGRRPGSRRRFPEPRLWQLSWVVLVVAGLEYMVLLRAFRPSCYRSCIAPRRAFGWRVLWFAVVVFRFGLGADFLASIACRRSKAGSPFSCSPCCSDCRWTTRFLRHPHEGSLGQGVDNGRAVAEACRARAGGERGGGNNGRRPLRPRGGRVAGLQELGAGLALGVLLDATVVRGLLMPSLMLLAGRWNWWLPAGVARVMRVEARPWRKAGARLVDGYVGLRLADGGAGLAPCLVDCRAYLTIVMARRMAGIW